MKLKNSFPRINISDSLRQTVRETGSEAELWLDILQDHAERRAEEWNLAIDEQLQHKGVCSIILGGRDNLDREVILKLSVPHSEVRYEAEAMHLWQGSGAVPLLNASDDGFDLLLERCVPGTDLWSLPIQEQIVCVSEFLPRLWVPVTESWPFARLDETVIKWLQEMRDNPDSYGVSPEIVKESIDWMQDLRSESLCMLHGDFNPGNVILDRRKGWRIIDPKPWAGDPAFDLAQLLFNWIAWYADRNMQYEEIAVCIEEHCRQLAEYLGINLRWMLLWALLKSFGWFHSSQTVLLLHGLLGS